MELDGIRDRILVQMDRNPYSATYGCLDRDYWHYRMVREFPSAGFQAAALALALLYRLRGEEKLVPAIQAAMEFWRRIQHPDGSFAEWYNHERSIVATAFTLCAMIEAVELMGNPPDAQRYVPAFKRAAGFLMRSRERFVMNHAAGAAAACYSLARLLNDPTYRAAGDTFLDAMDEHWSTEGWFGEYGGFDYGYHTVTLYYLLKVDSDRARQRALQMVRFLRRVLPPDNRVPFSIGSRGTAYLFCSPFAHPLIKATGMTVAPPRVLTLADSRYGSFFFYNDYLHYVMAGGGTATASPAPEVETGTYADSGILVRRRGRYAVYVGVKKNGAYAVVKEGCTQSIDNGILYEGDGAMFLSSFWNPRATFREDGDSVVISGLLRPLRSFGWGRRLLVPFKVYNATLGRAPVLAALPDFLLKHLGVRRTAGRGIPFERTIEIAESGVKCRDAVKGGGRTVSAPLVAMGFSPTSNLLPEG